jgi:geranylgeranyl diphosphate synthase type II
MPAPEQDDAPTSPREALARFAADFDAELARLLALPEGVPVELSESMRYTALLPGKRVRPFLVCRCCELVGGRREEAWPAAAAIECVHAFSLIHDDLPALDNDDLRRGRPANHKVHGENIAILAGDALLTLAFELLSRAKGDPSRSLEMVRSLSRAVGWEGMIGGQTADVLSEGQPPILDTVRSIHERKTAALIEAACRLGALAGGGSAEQVEALGRYGQFLGLAFQIADDLLDVEGSDRRLGKKTGKDRARGKQTYPACVGTGRSRDAACELVGRACEAIAAFRPAGDDLAELARYVVDRDF